MRARAVGKKFPAIKQCWMLQVMSVCTPCCMLARCVLLGVVAQSLKRVKLLATRKRTQQPPTMLGVVGQ